MKIGKYEFNNNKTYIVGILNLTPDSFYDGGSLFVDDRIDVDKTLRKVGDMIDDGADIIDIGGESTRPHARPISADEELSRIIPALTKIRAEYDIPISIDTYKPIVARTVIDEGADMINDIGFLPNEMLDVLSDNPKITYCLMHNRYTMIADRADNTITIDELNDEIAFKINKLLSRGVERDRIIIDPGLGFGKSNADDIMILANIDKLKQHNLPILIGASNKSCIDYILPSDKSDRLEGTLAVTAHSVYHNVNFIRVHDVKSNRRTIDMISAMRG